MNIQQFSLGLIGHPLEHSLSPRLHRAALQDLCLEGDYLLYDIPLFPEGRPEIEALLGKMRRDEIQGLNVTIPHKQAVISFVDEITPVAAAVGAVNTIIRRENCLVGDNTDVMGFMADLRNQVPGWSLLTQRQDRAALVLGAGGAARAVVYALASCGWKVRVASRRLEQAENLIEDLKRNSGDQVLDLEPVALEKNPLRNAAPDCQLIVNATPAGMFPNITTNPWPEGVPYPNDAFVYDLVYNPAETTLVREARLLGLKAVSGAGMLVDQAALAFEIWTGRPAPKEKMLEVLTISMRKTP
jgi:shikimate dehydrogenase